MSSAWRCVSSKKVHENPWFKVREDDVIRPDGNPGKYFVVDGIDSIAVIARDEDDLYYLVEQTRYPVGNIRSLEIVTGGVKDKKDPLEIAKSELREEAGLVAKSWESIGYFYPINGYDAEKDHVFLATDLERVNNDLEPTEDIKVKKLELEKIIDLIRNNEITDGITIAAFYKYLLYKEKI